MDQNLRNQIMGRVYTGYFLRQYGYSVINVGIFLLSSLALYFSVSWKNVFQNMPEISNTSESYNFLTSAVLNTEFIVQLSLFAIILVLLGYIASLIRRGSPKTLRQTI